MPWLVVALVADAVKASLRGVIANGFDLLVSELDPFAIGKRGAQGQLAQQILDALVGRVQVHDLDVRRQRANGLAVAPVHAG